MMGGAQLLRRSDLRSVAPSKAQGEPPDRVAEQASQPGNLAVHDRVGRLVGYVVPGYAGDTSQSAEILLENLAVALLQSLALAALLGDCVRLVRGAGGTAVAAPIDYEFEMLQPAVLEY